MWGRRLGNRTRDSLLGAHGIYALFHHFLHRLYMLQYVDLANKGFILKAVTGNYFVDSV